MHKKKYITFYAMADYIQLDSLEIQALMDTFGINNISNFELMEGGAENSSFIVKKGNNNFILSICNEKSFDQVHRLAKLLCYLTQKGFPTNRIIKSTSGELVINYKEKPVILKEYLAGNVCGDINYNMLFKLGALIGKLHQIPPPEYLPKCFPYGIDSFSQVFSKFPQSDYSKWLREKSDYIRRGLSPQLPTGLVHGDIFWDNVLLYIKYRTLSDGALGKL
ncbi:MAG: phosphotransferase, partial [Nanoarchaeota archaeon]